MRGKSGEKDGSPKHKAVMKVSFIWIRKHGRQNSGAEKGIAPPPLFSPVKLSHCIWQGSSRMRVVRWIRVCFRPYFFNLGNLFRQVWKMIAVRREPYDRSSCHNFSDVTAPERSSLKLPFNAAPTKGADKMKYLTFLNVTQVYPLQTVDQSLRWDVSLCRSLTWFVQ